MCLFVCPCGPAHTYTTTAPSVPLRRRCLAGSLTLALFPDCLLSPAMAAQLVVALLALASLCAASEPDCKELIKPLVLDSHSPVSISVCLMWACALVWNELRHVQVNTFTPVKLRRNQIPSGSSSMYLLCIKPPIHYVTSWGVFAPGTIVCFCNSLKKMSKNFFFFLTIIVCHKCFYCLPLYSKLSGKSHELQIELLHFKRWKK